MQWGGGYPPPSGKEFPRFVHVLSGMTGKKGFSGFGKLRVEDLRREFCRVKMVQEKEQEDGRGSKSFPREAS